MSSRIVVTMSGAFSVGRATRLTWELPRPLSIHQNGFRQDVTALRYTFTVSPTSSHDAFRGTYAVRQFRWSHPPRNTIIRVTEILHLTIRTDLAPFKSRATYPLRRVPPTVSRYLTLTPLLYLPKVAGRALISVTRGKRTERAVVEAVANWVASRTRFSRTATIPASQVFATRWGNCRGYDNLMAALLRYLGIPVQVEYGWVSATPVRLPGPNGGTSFVQWAPPASAGELHTWLAVYFPDVGWVPFDPQQEKFFVDTRHFGFLTTVDAGDPGEGRWVASYPPSTHPTGRTVAHGSIEIVPGDGIASRVTIHSKDAVRVQLETLRHDVPNVLLFSRQGVW